MENHIVLQGNITTNMVYTKALHLLRKHYKDKKSIAPIIDLTHVTYIEPEAVPLLIALGDYFSKLYRSMIDIEMEEKSDLQNFLINIGFHGYVKKQKFYNIPQNYINNWTHNNRDVHKIIWVKKADEYSDVVRIKDLELRRTYLSYNIQKNIEENCKLILSDTHNLPSNIINCTIEGLAEILTNASIYSQSQGYAYLASDRFGTKGSICDCGVGLQESFEQQGNSCEWILNNEDVINNPELKSYYLIMEIMNYSYGKHKKGERCNLWTVQNDLTRYGGIFKIHYGNIQVIFNSKKCKECQKVSYFDEYGKRICLAEDLKPCLKCLRDEYLNNQNVTIRNYEVAFRGVHIEFEIPRG